MTGNNTPVFFVRDPIKFPDFIHTQKRNPQTNCKDPDMFWDFLSLVPESIHQVMILFSDRGIPDGYRFMHGHSSHTYKFINNSGEVTYFKMHFKSNQGIKCLPSKKALDLAGSDPDYATRDLFDAISRKDYPSWTVTIQTMSQKQAESYRWNILDVTKVWPHADFPEVAIGRIVLNRNPENYFAEVEQAAFSPSHTVPGIQPSEDKMLQGRLFSYPDTHRHRLGPNYTLLPINRPKNGVHNHMRDGAHRSDSNGGSAPNYEPNSTSHQLKVFPKVLHHQIGICDHVGRHSMPIVDDDFRQANALYELMTQNQKRILVENICGSMGKAKAFIQKRQLANFRRVNKSLADALEKELCRPSF